MDALNTSVKLPEPFSVTSDPFCLTRSHAELILCEAEPRLWCAATEQVDGPLDCSGQQAVDCGTEQPNARENFFLSEQEPPAPTRIGQDARRDELLIDDRHTEMGVEKNRRLVTKL